MAADEDSSTLGKTVGHLLFGSWKRGLITVVVTILAVFFLWHVVLVGVLHLLGRLLALVVVLLVILALLKYLRGGKVKPKK